MGSKKSGSFHQATKDKANLNNAPMSTVFKRDKSPDRRLKIAVRGENAKNTIGKITPGCEIFGFTKGQFSKIDMIEHIINEIGPADITVCTWSASDNDIKRSYALLKSGDAQSFKFLVDFSFQGRKSEACKMLLDFFGHDACRVSVIHAKFILLKNKDWNIVVRTTMNLNFNPRFEHFDISDDPVMMEFMDKIVDYIWSNQNAAVGFERKPYDAVKEFKTWDMDSKELGGGIAGGESDGDIMDDLIDGLDFL